MKKSPISIAMIAIVSTFLVACDSKKEAVPYNDISFYQDTQSSQFAESPMVESVVQLNLGDSIGTGFFVSYDGKLVTNNHVLGTSNCLQEGCYVKLFQNFEKGLEEKSHLVFAEPLHIDQAGDISVFQIYTTSKDVETGVELKTNRKFSSSSYAEIASVESPENLINSEVYTIGHPLGALKKVTPLTVLSTTGRDYMIGGAVISGQSGSPVVNSAGQVIGVLKTSSIRFTDMAVSGVNTAGGVVSIEELKPFFMSTTSGLSLQSSTKGRIDELSSIESSKLTEEWHKNLKYFYHQKSLPSALAEKGEEQLLEDLANRCEMYSEFLEDGTISASESEQGYTLSDCVNMDLFLNCSNSDSENASAWWGHSFCPSSEKQKKYSDLLLKVFDAHYKATKDFNLIILSKATFSLSKSEAADLFFQKLYQHQPKIDFNLALQILAQSYSKGDTEVYYQGVDIVSMFIGYRSNPNYKYFVSSVINGLGLIYMNTDHQVDIMGEINALVLDPQVSLADKFVVEAFAYYAGVYPLIN